MSLLQDEKPWRVCGDYIRKLPDVKEPRPVLVTLPEGYKWNPFPPGEYQG